MEFIVIHQRLLGYSEGLILQFQSLDGLNFEAFKEKGEVGGVTIRLSTLRIILGG